MSQYPLVTVVTATRNRKQLLERLIQSVIAQTYKNVEHVVVDGLSNDGTQELLARYEKKYRLRWISEKDRNQVEAINKGLRMAQGEYVTVTHDDDYWLPEGIAVLMKEAVRVPDADIIYGDSWGEYADGNRVRRRYRRYTLDDMLNRGYQIPQDGSIFRRSWLPNVGYLDERIEYVPEYELFLRIMRSHGTVRHIPEVTSVGGLHEEKKSWVGAKRSWDETWTVNRKHGGRFFSPFTLLFVKNRYLRGFAGAVKMKFPKLFQYAKRRARTPEY